MAYLRVIQNTNDNISLKRIINVPKRGLGDTTVSKAEGIANERGSSIYSVISNIGEGSSLSKSKAKLNEFTNMIDSFIAEKDKISLSVLLEHVLEKTEMIKQLEAEDTVEAKTRIENIKEFQSVILEFERENGETSLESFLESISLSSDVDSMDEEENAVLLMTLHSAKGLEFPIVFIPGVEEGVFPSARAMFDEFQIEEERRLCYVGMTRAMKVLYLLNAKTRTLFGNTSYNKPARFLSELDMNYAENVSPVRETKSVAPSFASASVFTLKDFNMGDFNFKEGDRVLHKKFGKGTIRKIEGEDEEAMVEIDFDNYGMKRLMAAYAKLAPCKD